MSLLSAFVLALAFFFSPQTSLVQAEIPVKEGEKIAFLGDSITAAGYSNAGGADLNADMQAALDDARKSSSTKGNLLTTDGAHMAFAGDAMMATGVLKSLNLDTKEMAKAKDAWMDLPNTNVVETKVSLTQRQAEKLQKKASSSTSLGEMIHKEVNEHVLSLVK